MKCLLISLSTVAHASSLNYIAANVLAKGHDARILLLPGYLEPALDPAIENFIKDYKPDLIGISLMSIEFYPSKNITNLIHSKFDIPVIWGGVHVSFKPEDCIKYADYICLGEGENVVVSLLDHLDNQGKEVVPEVPGIWVRLNGKIIKQPVRSPEINLDSLPFPELLPDYYYGFHDGSIYNFAQNSNLFYKYALYGGTQYMMYTSRGCPFKCGFCSNSAFIKIHGRNVRKRSPENCIEELKKVKKHSFVLYINFQDDCFFVHSREWIKKFCDEYKRHIKLPFIVRSIPTILDKEKLKILKDAGLSVLIMGVQTGSDRVNFDIYDRKIPFASVKKAAELISGFKLLPFYEMIVDNPYETEDDRIESINAITELKKPFTFSLSHLTFFPGTTLTQKALNDNIIDPEEYLYRYMAKIDYTYHNKLLYMIPCLPRFCIRYLNKPAASRKPVHLLLTNTLFFLVKRTCEPVLHIFLVTRSSNYNIKWTLKIVLAHWKTAWSKYIFNFPSKVDMDFDKRLAMARKKMPSLFEK